MRRLLTLACCLALSACSAPVDPPSEPPAGAPTPATSSPSPSGPASSEPASSQPAASEPASSEPASSAPVAPPPGDHEFTVIEHEALDEPWAMVWLPGTETLAITLKGGGILLRTAAGSRRVSGTPEVTAAGQGGMGDLIAGPTFAADGTVYLSWVESGSGGTGAVVGRARLDLAAASLTGLERIWEQTPKADRGGHYSHRLAIRDGYLFVSSGDRQEYDPAQDLGSSLGKILRLTLDGEPAAGNPFDSAVWTLGHRNALGLAFDAEGRLWSSEMGPQGGDELNLIREGLNYGWPEASNGSNYSGTDIPDHAPGDGFEAPLVWWNPSVSPGSLMIYQGDLFPSWKGDAFLGALSGKALIRVDLAGETATLAKTWPMGARIREVEEGPDGAIWLLQDGGSLLELRPA